jgi:hypothetical protein
MNRKQILITLGAGLLLGVGLSVVTWSIITARGPETAAGGPESISGEGAGRIEQEVGTDAPAPGDWHTLVNAIDEIQDGIENLDKRVEAIESRPAVVASAQPAPEPAVHDVDEVLDQQDADTHPTAAQLEKQAARKAYYESMEQAIWTAPDEAFTEDVATSFREMVASREDWAGNASIEVATCGGSYCKLVLNYDNDMDPTALFELDAGVFLWNKDLPTATAYSESLPDGTTNMVLYFARRGADLPVLP